MRRIRVLLWSVVCFVCVGCGGRLDLHEVTGTVKFTDGTVPQGEISMITFSPVVQLEGKAASSEIAADGTFELFTLDPGDGALAGDYKVTVHVIVGYPQSRSLVAKKYTDVDTPLTATVKASEKNHFDFEVEKP